MGYLRNTLNYPKRISLSDLTHIMSIADLVAIGVETLRIDSGCSLGKEFTKLILMNQVYSCHTCVCGPLT